tara:strand:- start:41 stop:352 length:312 start_codon:yes stop_codon:yes gene_type:complete
MKKSLLLILAFLSVASPLFLYTQEAKAGSVKGHCWVHKKKYKSKHWIKVKKNQKDNWTVVRDGYQPRYFQYQVQAYNDFKGARNGLRGRGDVKCSPSWWETYN